MYYLGFHADHHKKGYYVDCHERGDVVFHREEFLPVMLDYETRSRHWTGQNMEIEHPPILREGEKEIVFITHDESIVYCNDATTIIWTMDDEAVLRPKSNGRSLHVSGFVCACHGFGQTSTKKSYKIITPGKNADGYWTNKDLIQQLEDEAFEVMEALHSNCELVFGFDNSANHHAKAPDGLCAKSLNLSDGGKNCPQLRNSTWNGETFYMQGNDFQGMLLERAREILAAHDDFKNQRSWLREIVENRAIISFSTLNFIASLTSLR